MQMNENVHSLLFFAIMLSDGILMTCTVRRVLPVGRGPIRRFAPLALFTIVPTMPSWLGDENPLLMLPFFMLVFFLCYGGPWFARGTVGIVFYELLISLNMFFDTTSRWYEFLWFERLPSMLLKLVLWLVIFLCVRRLLPGGQPVTLSPRLWVLIGVLSLSSLFSMLSFSIWGILDFTTNSFDFVLGRVANTFLPFVFLSSLALLFAIALLSRHEALEIEHKLADMREVYYQSLKREQQQVRTLRHDMRNHLTALSGLLARNDAQKAREYVQSLSQSPALVGVKRFCENETVNAVLASKAGVIEHEGLTADIGVSLPENLPVSDPDLCALFGNALDNAIEAAKTAHDKRITVRARTDKGLLMLRVANAYAGEREQLNKGLFGTTKADKASHGFGLAGMREIAVRHGGTLEANADKNRFELVVCIPLDDAE